MKRLLLLFIPVSVFAYEQKPRIEDPETIIHKLDRIAFKGMNLSIRGLNDLNLTHKLTETQKIKFEGYAQYNLMSHNKESGVRAQVKW